MEDGVMGAVNGVPAIHITGDKESLLTLGKQFRLVG